MLGVDDDVMIQMMMDGDLRVPHRERQDTETRKIKSEL
jgi:hypothetical protein